MVFNYLKKYYDIKFKFLKMKYLINIILYCFIFIGVAGFLGANFIFKRELPFSDIKGIVVDNLENIYVGLQFYGKIQVYDKNGNFIKNWNVHNYGGNFYLDISEDDKIIIYTARGHKKLIYNNKGTKVFEGETDFEFEKRNPYFFLTKSGNNYEIFKGLFSKIFKNNEIIVKQNLYLNMLTVPQCFLISFIGFILLAFINYKNIIKK